MVAPVQFQTPGVETRSLGGGFLSLRKVGETTWKEVLALTELSYSVATESKKAYSLRTGKKTIAASANISFEATGKFKVESANADNVGLFFSSPDDITTVLQTAGSWTNQLYTVVEPMNWHDLGKKRCSITNVKKITYTVPATGTADGGNTGNGTCTTVTGGTIPKIGTYTVECTAEATDSGTFSVADPDGNDLGDATVGTPFTSDQINLTVNDGTTDFKVGDKFTIAVTGAAGDSLVEGTDYLLDEDHGLIAPCSVAYKAASQLGVVGKQFYVNGTYPALTEYDIQAGKTTSMEYELFYCSKNVKGFMEEVYAYANLKPQGDLPMIAEDWKGFSFDFECMAHDTYGASGLRYKIIP